jgi:hypothetical protein
MRGKHIRQNMKSTLICLSLLAAVLLLQVHCKPPTNAADLKKRTDACVKGCDRTCGGVGLESEATKSATSCQAKCDACVEMCIKEIPDGNPLRCRNWCIPIRLPEAQAFSKENMRERCKQSSVLAHHTDQHINSLV